MEEKLVPNFSQTIDRSGTHAEKYESRGRIFGNDTVQPLWVADMDLPAPPFLQDALTQRIEHPCYGYTEQNSTLKESVQWWMQEEHNVAIDTIDILFSPSVVTSFNNAIQAFSSDEDGVALFSPVYGPFYFAIKNHNRTLVDIPLTLYEGEYQIDFPTFKKQCKAGKIQVLLLCNPQNPSGRVWKRDELEALVKICKAHNVTIVSDEIHSDIVYAPAVHTSLFDIDGGQDCAVVLHSIGKTFNTSGLQASFVLAKNRRLRKKLHTVAELSHTSDINVLGKVAIETLFSREGQQYKESLLSYLAENQETLLTRLQRLPKLQVMPADATFLSWINFSKTGLSHGEVMDKLVNEAGLGLGGGLFFGPVGDGWFRFNFAISRAMLDEALTKLEQVFG